MLFCSMIFLWAFLPAILILYHLINDKYKNFILLIFSLIFYAWGEPRYVILMVVSILAGWFFGLLLEKYRGKGAGRLVCVLSVGISLSFLLYFKYGNFFLENLGAVTGQEIALIQAALPIGISFYTFQIISYTLDVYRGERAERNLINLAAYITMFPQLIAGPIVRYAGIAGRMEKRGHSWEEASEGIRRFVIGLAKKILLANQLGELCGVFRASSDKSVLFYWLYATALILQIYFDFSGYSDMAIGLGKMFGFHFLENFEHPYVAKSITEFWRRWHISLSSWFREYVYIPLGGNRRGMAKQVRNIFVVWMLTGIWHGASWNYVLWGLYYGCFLILEKFVIGKWVKKLPGIFQNLYTLLIVVFGWVIFKCEDLTLCGSYLKAMFGGYGAGMFNTETIYLLYNYAVLLVILVLGCTTLPKRWGERLLTCFREGGAVQTVLRCAFCAGIFVISVAYLVDATYNPFLYFRF